MPLLGNEARGIKPSNEIRPTENSLGFGLPTDLRGLIIFLLMISFALLITYHRSIVFANQNIIFTFFIYMEHDVRKIYIL